MKRVENAFTRLCFTWYTSLVVFTGAHKLDRKLKFADLNIDIMLFSDVYLRSNMYINILVTERGLNLAL